MTVGRIYIDDRVRTRDEILVNAKKGASGLSSIGAGDGTVISLLLHNDFVFFEATLAARQIGSYCVPLNWHNKVAELEYVIKDSDPVALIGHADLLLEAQSIIPDGLPVLVVPSVGKAPADCPHTQNALRSIDGAVLWDEWVANFAPMENSVPATRGTVVYTSGTTGNPKAVLREPMHPVQYGRWAANQQLIFGIVPRSRAIVVGPLYHASPNSNGIFAVLNCEVAIFYTKFEPERFLRDVEHHQITTVVCVPTIFVRLLKLPDDIRSKYDLSSLVTVTHTGGPCSPDIKRMMIDWLGPIINEVYGGTETGSIFFCSSAEWLEHPGTVGRALPGVRFRLYDEAGQIARPGDSGEIYARGINGDFTYKNQEAARREVERDGLITLGDVGSVDADGFLFLHDRKRDMVVSGGVNIYPVEIESVLLTHPLVSDCAVFGLPDDDLGEMLVVMVEPLHGSPVGEDDIKDYIRNRLSGYKVPKRVFVRPQLARQDSGKLFKRVLKSELMKELDATAKM